MSTLVTAMDVAMKMVLKFIVHLVGEIYIWSSLAYRQGAMIVRLPQEGTRDAISHL